MGVAVSRLIAEAIAAKGLSQKALADQVGASQQLVSAWVSKGVIPTEWERIAAALDIPADTMRTAVDADRAGGPAYQPKEKRPTRATTADRMVPFRPVVSTGRIPILGQASAGEPDRMVMLDVMTETVPCPPQLLDVADAYAVYVHGTSMVPRYYPGEIIYVHPHRPPNRDDYCIVQIQHPGEEHPQGYVKQFVSLDSHKLTVHQHNPDSVLTFDKDVVAAVHLVVGSTAL